MMIALALAGAELAHGRNGEARAMPALTFGELGGLDIDGDGAISRDEFMVLNTERFEALDLNRDRKVSAAEMRTHRLALGGGEGSVQAAATDQRAIDLADTNQDAQLDHSEFAWLGAQVFTALDHNNDGFLSLRDR
ncbi:hypothetical protein [Roseibium sp. RKSG952]|uniref:hypothetical protein n=1 Tax=Roseibium sp. RKSG952 TaxID=2529384 RepID=UPI0018AD1CBE|nr:hypothetical protein [Roseibium sp. RKSG952]